MDTEEIEEAGTPPILGVVKLYLALKLRNDAGLEVIKQRENMLKEYFYNKISKINEIRLYGGDLKDRMAIFSFDIKGFDSHKFAGILSQKYGVMCRAGCLCAGPYGHDLLGLDDHQAIENKPNFVRISLHYTHDEDDIDYLVSAIKYIVKIRDKIRLSQGRYQC